MVGYNLPKMESVNALIAPIFESIETTRVKTLSSFYSVVMGIDESLQLQKEIFSVLYILAALNEKNFGASRTKSIDFIFNSSIVHKLNRALYGQRDVESAIAKPSEFGSWRLRAFSEISDGNYFRALAIMAIKYKTDFDKMFIEGDEIRFMLNSTSLFSSKTDITFERIKNAVERFQDRQV